MSDCLIEFHCLPNISPTPLPEPIPATQAMPDWLKAMPASVPRRADPGPRSANPPPAGEQPTIKKCPPLVDALTSGYLIPLVADVAFSMDGDRLRFKSDLPLIDAHPPDQVRGSPFDNGMAIVKFLNPWLIRTPPGYSCLIMHPLNRFDMPFNLLAGVVETDTFYSEVNFPSVCLLKPGQQFVARKGTPLAHVFPFKREAWASQTGVADTGRRRAILSEMAGGGYYKANHWVRKAFE